MERFSLQWWHNKPVNLEWFEAFCEPFFEADPSLAQEPVRASLATVFFNKTDGTVVPVGITALKSSQFIFQYHPGYLEDETLPAISVTFPKRIEPYISDNELPPFFDNLLAEGWFGKVQSSALNHNLHVIDEEKENIADRYHRMNMFGRDYPGAVWMTYIAVDPDIAEELYKGTVSAALQARASISGVQPKLLGVMQGGRLHPANYWETSTHIIKLPSDAMPGLMEYEYMSILATKALLPQDETVNASLTDLHLRDGNIRKVLAIERFDRTEEKGKIHFEEFNQLLGKTSKDRYNGLYSEMTDCMKGKMDEEKGKEAIKQFYARLVCQFLLGNTDSHFKNFALFNDNDTWRLTPNYDLAPTVNFKKGALALGMRGEKLSDILNAKKSIFSKSPTYYRYKAMDARVIVTLGREFGIENKEIEKIINALTENIDAAKEAIRQAPSDMLDETVGYFRSRNQNTHRNTTFREDFCTRIDGRCTRLFSELETYMDRITPAKHQSFSR